MSGSTWPTVIYPTSQNWSDGRLLKIEETVPAPLCFGGVQKYCTPPMTDDPDLVHVRPSRIEGVRSGLLIRRYYKSFVVRVACSGSVFSSVGSERQTQFV